MEKSGELFSFVLSSDFSSFRKFDSAGDFYLAYFFIPRPTVLGIIGSILGLKKSVKDDLPWWRELKDTKIAIEPLNMNPIRHLVVYNNSSGAAFYDSKVGQILNVKEQILINPKYRIYVELNEKTKTAFKLLEEKKSVFVPYLGKNEFRAEISEVEKYRFVAFNGRSVISSIYPSRLKETEKFRSVSWMDANKAVQILESHPYTYTKNYKYMQEVFIFSPDEVNTELIKSCVDGNFVQLDRDKRVIYLYGNKK
jgi:CRISPR-associated protein Cas5h